MAGSSPDIRLQVAALLDGTIDLDQFQRWFASAEMAIEVHGSDADVDLANRVFDLLAQYTGDHISESVVLRALCEETACREPADVSAVA
jgi:hypothetical protein